MKITTAIFFTVFLLYTSNIVRGQNDTISGKVLNINNNKAVENAHVVILNSDIATITERSGKFLITGLKPGKYKIKVTHIGFEPLVKTINIPLEDKKYITIFLKDKIYEGKTVVVTGTRTIRDIQDVPGKIEVITRKEIEKIPGQKIDDILQYISGLNVYRSNGTYTIRPVVTLRGLSGDEQGRTLVLIDGVPINKGDTGGVNWNRINKEDIEKIEIYKGPGSSLYGSNAMGGVINIITRKPVKKFEGSGNFGYGTYNTKSVSLYTGSKYCNNGYVKLSGFITDSDGYNATPDSLKETPDYSTKRYLKEYSLSVKTGYDFTDLLKAEIQYDYYKDKRGEGEKIIASDGEYRHFNTNFLRGHIYGSGKSFNYNLLTYYQHENYLRIDERMQKKDTTFEYKRFDVDSDRKDMGLILYLNYNTGKNNIVTLGTEMKNSRVDGGDYYKTSPDSVINSGKMNNFAIYLQDELSLAKQRLKILFGIRYDFVRFYDGEYYNTDGSWASIIPALTDHNWDAFSPRIAVNYKLRNESKIYASYSHGFRASILDDLCRSGWMWVGPKIANPELGPEKIDNYEIGAKYKIMNVLTFSPALFYTSGHDFLYYVQTKDSLWGKRPVFQRQNITEVNIYGAEIEIQYDISENISLFANYTYNDSRIAKFEQNPQLENKYLKYTPKHQAKAAVFWSNKIVNINLSAIYKSTQFIDDENTMEIKNYTVVNLGLSRNIIQNLGISLSINNIFDTRYMENYEYMAPGRIITGRINFAF